MWRCGRRAELLPLKAGTESVRCTPRLRFAPELAVFVAQAQPQLRTVLAIGLQPSLQLGYIGTRHGSDTRFSSPALLKGVRAERKGTEVSETPADIWGGKPFF